MSSRRGNLPKALANRAADHGHRWVAAYAILARRAVRFRPRTGIVLPELFEAGAESCGYDASAVNEVVRDVEPNESVCSSLAVGSTIVGAMTGRLPDIERRIERMVQAQG